MKILMIGLLSLLLATAGTAYADQLDDASVKLFKAQMSLAEQGRPQAQFYLGEMFAQGLGTKQDLEQAFIWYAKAADQGYVEAKRKMDNREALRQQMIKDKELAAEKERAIAKAIAAGRERVNAPEPPAAAGTAAPKTAAPAKPVAAPPVAVASIERERPAKAGNELAEKETQRARARAAEQEELRRKLVAFQEAMAREKEREKFSSGF